MKTFRDFHAEECYWSFRANCTIPIGIYLLYLYIKTKIKGDKNDSNDCK